ncbi:MAG: hypothetical protein JJE28_06780 [Actinomycetales bacterium]|nr:hypothetical protein [Actinomycetales bacterium]
MTPKVTDTSFRIGRLKKANQFAEAASVFFDEALGSANLGDTYVTLAIHCGIAASDVICAAKLGEYSAADSHSAAVAMLKKANPAAAVLLSRLLELKTKAGYGHRPVSAADIRKAEGAHKKLLHLAELA